MRLTDRPHDLVLLLQNSLQCKMHVSLITCIVHHQATVLEFDAEYSEVKL